MEKTKGMIGTGDKGIDYDEEGFLIENEYPMERYMGNEEKEKEENIQSSEDEKQELIIVGVFEELLMEVVSK